MTDEFSEDEFIIPEHSPNRYFSEEEEEFVFEEEEEYIPKQKELFIIEDSPPPHEDSFEFSSDDESEEDRPPPSNTFRFPSDDDIEVYLLESPPPPAVNNYDELIDFQEDPPQHLTFSDLEEAPPKKELLEVEEEAPPPRTIHQSFKTEIVTTPIRKKPSRTKLSVEDDGLKTAASIAEKIQRCHASKRHDLSNVPDELPVKTVAKRTRASTKSKPAAAPDSQTLQEMKKELNEINQRAALNTQPLPMAAMPWTSSSRQAASFVFPSFGQTLALKDHLRGAAVDESANLNNCGEGMIPGMIASNTSSASSSSSSSSSTKGISNMLDLLRTTAIPKPIAALPITEVLEYIKNVTTELDKQFLHPMRMLENKTPQPCPRAHVEKILYEAYRPFKACIAGERCVCNAQYGFIMMEYLSPSVYALVSDHNIATTIDQHTYCYLCWLSMTNYAYTEAMNSGLAVATIQIPFFHIVGQAGEYRQDAVLEMSNEIPPVAIGDSVNEIRKIHQPSPTIMVRPFRTMNFEHFTKAVADVCVKGVVTQVNVLKECPDLMFDTHPTHIDRVRQTRPLQYTHDTYYAVPGTDSVLSALFSKPLNHLIGTKRMLQYGRDPRDGGRRVKKCEAFKDGILFVPSYWCMAHGPPGVEFEPFPWAVIFEKDIRVTIRNMRQIVRGGRISIYQVLKMGVCDNYAHRIVPKHSLDWYSNQLESPIISSQLYAAACKLRIVILNTIKAVYPKSKNSTLDDTVHVRLDIFLKWNMDNYSPSHISGLTDYDIDHIIHSVPIPYKMFRLDSRYMKVKRTLVTAETPAEKLAVIFPKHHDIFVEFDSLVRAVRDRKILSSKNIDSHFTLIPIKTVANHSIYIAMMLRINLAYYLYDQYGLDDTARYNLRLFAYTHLDLAYRIALLGDCTDDTLNSVVERNNINYVLTHLDENYPHSTRTPHQGMVPDITNVLHCIPFAPHQSISKQKTDPILYMFACLMPKISEDHSKPRKFVKDCNNAQRETVSLHETYMVLTAIAVELSVLGAYEHARIFPDFKFAIQIHALLNTAFTPQRFMAWQETRIPIAILAMREMLVYLIRNADGFRRYLNTEYPGAWSAFEERVLMSADLMREICKKTGDMNCAVQPASQLFMADPSFEDHFAISDKATYFIERAKEIVQATPIRFFPPLNAAKVDTMATLHSICVSINMERACRRIQRQPIDKILMVAIEARARTINTHEPFSFSCLLDFNFGQGEVRITSDTVALMDCAAQYVRAKCPISKATNAIKMVPLDEYEIVFNLVSHLYNNHSTVSIPVDSNFLMQQLAAVSARYTGSASISPASVSLQYARCCGVVRSYVSQIVSSASYGGKNLGFNIDTGETICRRKVSTSKEKNTEDFYTDVMNNIANDDEKMMAKLFSRLKKRVSSKSAKKSTCGDVPVTSIPLLGYVVQIAQQKTPKYNQTINSFTLCGECGAVSTFNIRYFGVNGFSCMACSTQHTLEYYTPECIVCLKQSERMQHSFYVIDDIHDADDRPCFTSHRRKKFFVCDRCYNTDKSGYREYSDLMVTSSHLAALQDINQNNMVRIIAVVSGDDFEDYRQNIETGYSSIRLNRLKKQKISEFK